MYDQKVDIFGSLAIEKKAKVQKQNEKKGITQQVTNSKAGKLQQSMSKTGLSYSDGVQSKINDEDVCERLFEDATNSIHMDKQKIVVEPQYKVSFGKVNATFIRRV